MASPKENGALPRLGSEEAPKRADLESRVVQIPDRGVSVVLQKPKLGVILEMQESIEEKNDDFSTSLSVVSTMLAEPNWSEDELRTEVVEWSMTDWQFLQEEALELAGMSKEARSEMDKEFRKE